MSTALDLQASVSLSVAQIGDEDPANGPGPGTTPGPSLQACSKGGHSSCAPLVATQTAPLPDDACVGFGDARPTTESNPPMPNGEPYPGNLLADILEYRRMRARVLASPPLPQSQEERYEQLQHLLCAFEPCACGHGRAYHRFDIRVSATLCLPKGRGLEYVDVGVENISAGGVKLVGARARAEGERVELRMSAGEGRTVVLPARVAWMRQNAVGLMFAGAARWQ